MPIWLEMQQYNIKMSIAKILLSSKIKNFGVLTIKIKKIKLYIGQNISN